MKNKEKTPADLAATGVLEETGKSRPLHAYYSPTPAKVNNRYLAELKRLEHQAERMGLWYLSFELALLHARAFLRTMRAQP